jgi:hypothetical protein
MTSSEGTVIVNLNNQKMEYTISKNLGQDYLAASFSGSMGIVSQGIGGKVAIVVDILDGIVTGVFDSHLNEDKNFSHIVGTAASAFLLGEAGARAGLIIGGLPGAVLGALVGGVAGALFGDDIDYNVTALIHNLAIDFNEFKYSDVTTVYDVTANKIIIEDIANNDPNFCKNIFPQYLNDRQIVDIKSGSTLAESVRYDNTTNEITISNSTSYNQNFYLNETLKNNDIDKATINDIVYIKQDLTNQTSLQIRNLLTDINSVNILLSNVLIKIDEKLDLGDKGIYTVKSGDTFSQIANNNGFTTKELLEKNTWLIDENRITFNTLSEILVKQTADLYNNNQNHTLIGTNSDDILIDHNGGDDLFEAGTGTNYIDGGEGSDTISYKSSLNKEGIKINLSLATAQAINSTTTDTLVNIENVIGSKYSDTIYGSSFDVTTLEGERKTHILEGYEGSDEIYGAYNSVNVIYGDTKENPFGSSGIFDFGSNRDEYGNIIEYDDWLYGGKTTDAQLLASGNLTQNYLYGGEGSDYLRVGWNADNFLYGGAGDDLLSSSLIGFKNESAGIDYSKGSSYLNGGEGFDTYGVKDYVTIEDDDGRGEIGTKYGKLSSMSKKILSNGTILLLKNNPQYIGVTTTSNPLAGYSSGAFGNILGRFTTTTTQGMLLDSYEMTFKITRDGNDLILDDLSSSPTVIRIKNYVPNSLNLNISQTQFDNLPAYSGGFNSPSTPVQIGSDEAETLVGSEVNNTYTSNKGDDTLKDTAGGNDTYNFSLGDQRK